MKNHRQKNYTKQKFTRSPNKLCEFKLDITKYQLEQNSVWHFDRHNRHHTPRGILRTAANIAPLRVICRLALASCTKLCVNCLLCWLLNSYLSNIGILSGVISLLRKFVGYVAILLDHRTDAQHPRTEVSPQSKPP
jgi:hypothetical protein